MNWNDKSSRCDLFSWNPFFKYTDAMEIAKQAYEEGHINSKYYCLVIEKIENNFEKRGKGKGITCFHHEKDSRSLKIIQQLVLSYYTLAQNDKNFYKGNIEHI